MDFRIRISETALADFKEILEYSWAKFPDTAERFGADVLNHVELLAAFPHVGSSVPGSPGVRLLVHTPILIYYRVHEASAVVEILSFRHSARKGSRPGTSFLN